MSEVGVLDKVEPGKLDLPDRVRRELRKGETIYHSAAACHVSAKHPTGKWVGQVRREEKGRLTKYPVKAFGTPQDALAYVKSLRIDSSGRVFAARQGESTVTDLFEFVKRHKWKRLGAKRQELKESRWRNHIEPYWGLWALSQVTKRAAQEWITEMEDRIRAGGAGSLGLPQFNECRMDLHGIFEAAGSFDERLEDRKNPFAGLDFTPRQPRPRICIESQSFATVDLACRRLVETEFVTDWVVGMFLTSLLGGLRLGEVVALCREQIDFDKGAIKVDRAMRESDRELDARTMLPTGQIQRTCINLPKGDKTRVVPMSAQLASVLKPFFERPRVEGAKWDLIFPSETGGLKESTRVSRAFKTLCKRLDELAQHESRRGRGWPKNLLISEFASIALPDVWQDIDFRDTRNSFASYAEEVGVQQATREAILGHGPKGVTNRFYTDVTSKGFQMARKKLTQGWTRI